MHTQTEEAIDILRCEKLGSRVDVAGNACRRGLKILLKLLVHICWDVAAVA